MRRPVRFMREHKRGMAAIAIVMVLLVAIANAAIDVGPGATDRTYTASQSSTRIDTSNSANATGTIESIEIWCNTDLSGVSVGTFFLVSGTTYECRDSAAIGSVTAGSKQTFNGLSISVEAGDYLGIYWTGGFLDLDITGGTALLSAAGDYTTPSAQASYSSLAEYAISIYATGTEAGSPPPKVATPSPANAATDQTTGVDVSWAAAVGATSYDVYFGTDSTPDADVGSSESKGNQAGTSYDPGTLSNAAIYYWRIDSVNATGTTTGDVWFFVTASAGGSAGSGGIFGSVVR